MEIIFATTGMMKICSSYAKMVTKYGAKCAKVLGQRLFELQAAPNMLCIPVAARCHPLKADRKGQYAVDLVHPLRLVFEPDYEAQPELPSDDLDLSQVKNIRVIKIIDYH